MLSNNLFKDSFKAAGHWTMNEMMAMMMMMNILMANYYRVY